MLNHSTNAAGRFYQIAGHSLALRLASPLADLSLLLGTSAVDTPQSPVVCRDRRLPLRLPEPTPPHGLTATTSLADLTPAAS
jgi:hypothetical protein